jgi:type IV pilus assembly protein PilN
MTELDKKIGEIESLKTKRKQLLNRMKIIQDLQGTRPIIVRIFDELVRTLPDGLYYESLKREGDLITIKGVAESNNRISSLMRNFELSDWFSDPNLTDVSAKDKAGTNNQFDMTVLQVTPKESKGEKK